MVGGLIWWIDRVGPGILGNPSRPISMPSTDAIEAADPQSVVNATTFGTKLPFGQTFMSRRGIKEAIHEERLHGGARNG
jgi:hypothetical protein